MLGDAKDAEVEQGVVKSETEEISVAQDTLTDVSSASGKTFPSGSGDSTTQDDVISFEDVTVMVPATGCKCLSLDPFKTWAREYLSTPTESHAPFFTVQRVSGYVKRGEMVLLLGAAGSGRSSLLRAVSGRLNKKDDLHGTVLFNGVPITRKSPEWQRATCFVSSADDTHSPLLTVKETFRFAAQCTSRYNSSSTVDERVQRMLRLLNLENVADTQVGDENVRGVSGGQKRRVTIGEMLLNHGAPFLFVDDAARGLDSVSTATLLGNISKLCKEDRFGAFVAIESPTSELLQLADKILALDREGRMVYFGPAHSRNQLESALGPNTLSHSLPLGEALLFACSSSDTDTVVDQFAHSDAATQLTKELGAIRAQGAKRNESLSHKVATAKTKGLTSFGLFWVILKRQATLIARNAMTYARIAIAIVFGIIVGSLFSASSDDLIGALAVTGFMFLSIFLVFMLSSAVTLPSFFRQRNTFFKQRAAGFYPTWLFYLAQTIVDMPLSLLEAVLLAVIPYFWIGLKPTAGAFFYFLFVLFGIENVGQSLARLISAFSATEVLANAVTSTVIILFGSLAGFMPTYTSIGWWYRWFSFLNPAAYAYEGVMLNNFEDTTMYAVSFVLNGTEIDVGHVNGSSYLEMQSLPRIAWGTPTQIMVLDIVILYIFALFFNVLAALLAERGRVWYSDQTRRPLASARDKLRPLELPAEPTTDSDHQASSHQKEQDIEEPVNEQVLQEETKSVWAPETLSIKDLCYTVSTGYGVSGPALCKGVCTKSGKGEQNSSQVSSKKRQTLQLLNNVSATFRKGRMTALMGESGAGKSTLLDVIAGMKTSGEVTGSIFVDNFPKRDLWWRRISAYAEQNDILNPYLSVQETVLFTATCCSNLSDGERQHLVNECLDYVDLQDKATVIVGHENRNEGLAKHERKRLTIAVALSQQPKILFLDEPTSGLGSHAAIQVMQSVRKATSSLGLITVVTIHQPGATVFSLFDDLLVLMRGGTTVYHGPIGGKSCSEVLRYLGEPSSVLEDCEDPSDFLLSYFAQHKSDAVEKYQSSSECSHVQAQVTTLSNTASSEMPSGVPEQASSWVRFCALWKRQFTSQWRNPNFSMVRIYTSVLGCLYLGFLFFQLDDSVQSAVFAIAAIFFAAFLLVVPMQASVVPLVEERAVVFRETRGGMYSEIMYSVSQLVTDIPFHVLNAVLFLILYGLVGFRSGAEYVGYYLLMMILLNWVVPSIGQLFAFASPNEETANGLAGLSVILSVILMGFLITVNAMPSGWQWAYWANLFHYGLQGLVTNEISGQHYQLPLPDLFPNVTDASSAVLLQPGTVPFGDNDAAVALRLIGLASDASDTGPLLGSHNTTIPLFQLLSCLVQNQCLTEPLYVNIFSCTIFNVNHPIRQPVCRSEYQAAKEQIGDIIDCFVNDTNTEEMMVLAQDENSQRDLILCLLRALLPAEWIDFILRVIQDLLDIIAVIVQEIKKGLPGDVLLWYFGWATVSVQGFSVQVETYKWYYCMLAVAMFLLFIEILKVIAVRFIVWIKR